MKTSIKNPGGLSKVVIFFTGVVLGGMLVFLVLPNLIEPKLGATKEAALGYRTNNQPEVEINLLEEKILTVGDTSSYEALRIAYLDKSDFEFLPWALYMANRFKYPQAYFDVYYSLFSMGCIDCSIDELDRWSLNKLDQKTRMMALEYLEMAKNMGHVQAREILVIYHQK
jgi:hypothetical protein